jgi:acetoin utilization deacetylase AcuC-like enzyme
VHYIDIDVHHGDGVKEVLEHGLPCLPLVHYGMRL